MLRAAPALTSYDEIAVGGGTVDAGEDFSVTCNETIASAAGATWNGAHFEESTATITGSTNITTATGLNFTAFEAPILSAASALTVTNAATVYIEGAPTGAGAGPATITNAYALWVDGGISRFDGAVYLSDGSAAAPSLAFASGTSTGFYRTGARVDLSLSGSPCFLFESGTFVVYSDSGRISIGLANDVNLFRDAANTLALRNSTNAQAWNIYGTYTDASNYERLSIATQAGTTTILQRELGTGTARDLAIGTVGASNLVFTTSNSQRWYVNSSGHFLAISDNTYDIGASGATRPRTGYFGTALVVGTNPATTGTIRLANNQAITSRNSANSSDASLLSLNSSDNILIYGGAWLFQSNGRLASGANYSFSHGTSALATNATEGYLHIQSCNGTPTGTPASIPTGQIPMIYDTSANKIWFYNGSWRGVVVS